MRIRSKSKIKVNKEEELRGQLVRALADYDNLRKRVEREKEEFEKVASLNLAIKLLPVLDVLRQAQVHLKDHGIAITIGQFEEALKSEGIEEVKVVKGTRFDPTLYEAVESISGGKKGTIAEEVLPGWRFVDGKIIRHAKVKVYGEKVNYV